MEQLQIYVCGHDQKTLDNVANKHFLKKINLNELEIGEFQRNEISETRIFLANLQQNSEYVGFLSANYNAKFISSDQPAGYKDGQRILPAIEKLDKIALKSNVLHFCILSHVRCKNWFCENFNGIEPYLNDIETQTGLSFNSHPSILANSFVCHWNVFQEFLKVWRPIFDYTWKKYPVGLLNSTIKGYADENRAAGYLYEAISMLSWAEVIKKQNLTLEHFEIPKKSFKRILV